ncbi:TolC family protein [Granulosicoccus antarcticus]|uniref:Transporter n=1 Tax=Granulosicoccus antarcticus IMCC3135 TaxID=1192854 RepID=A0A2Z2NY02_9GAMM|nr:TolC family protein [Granulosicoccus antarcticus]ASJ73710.1 hypothetical protein IMCC3135_18155 [Granulosicoccus antarcticus IMCC3135]
MKLTQRRITRPLSIAFLTTTVLSGCATFDVNESIGWTNEEAATFTGGNLELARTAGQRAARTEAATALLAEPLTRDSAVQLALVNSPTIQALIARSWETGASAAQTGRIPNPVFSFERLVSDDSQTKDLERFIAFGLLDVLLLPMKKGVAERGMESARVKLTSDVVAEVTAVRQAWTQAVAAKQLVAFAEQVRTSADASAEMGRRLESVGNFSRLERARQQVFYADATMQLATTRHEAVVAREKLIRALGLDDRQLAMLKLPERLPDLPAQPILPGEATQTLGDRRLDVRMAKASLDRAARAQGITNITSFTDIEVGYRETKATGPEESEELSGYEVEISLPLFDWGNMRRDAMSAQTLAAGNEYAATLRNASSSLRETYSAYRTSFDLSSFYRDEVVPLRTLISEENVMQYNGMLIGVFELLADSRTQTSSIMSAIEASEQFWMADAALQAAMMGRPMDASVGTMAAAGGGEEAGH